MAENHRGTAITVALIGAAATIAAALIAAGVIEVGSSGVSSGSGPGPTETTPPAQPPELPQPGASAAVFLSRDSGPGGTSVNVSGEGFSPNERIVISFHTEHIGSTTASDQGAFSNVAVTVPESFSVFAPQQFSVIARGQSSLQSALAPFTISG